MNYNFDDLNDRLNAICKSLIEQANKTEENKDLVSIFIPNLNEYRLRFQEKCPKDKFKYIDMLGDGYFQFPKSMYQYFKTILTKNNIPYEYIGD